MSNPALEMLIERKAKKAVELGASVEIVGSWVWATFPARPEKAAREAMIEESFRWNNKRGLWQFAGIRSHGSPADSATIKNKYGAREVRKEDDAQKFVQDHFAFVKVGA